MSNTPSSLKIKISGEAGDGILTIGDLLMKAAAHHGYFSAVFNSYPPNIRGGHSQALVTISENKITSPVSDLNILFTLSSLSFNTEFPKLKTGNLVLIESEIFQETDLLQQKIELLKERGICAFPVPVKQLTCEVNGAGNIRSTISLGILSVLIGLPPDLLDQIITARFKSKGKEILNLNRNALKMGFLWAKNNLIDPCQNRIPSKPSSTEKRIILGGNQAVSIASIAAGCTFFASYPITPATLIGEYLSEHIQDFGGFAYQAEDEIAALGSVIGASFSGAKAMTATSGPGLSLMQEFIGYASMVELPVVIVDVQRVGPSTGMPTKHSQDDLLAAAFGGHGEAPRIIVAPVNVEDCFHITIKAFNLAELYQCPVILLSDGTLGLMKETVEFPDINSIEIVNRDVITEQVTTVPFLRFKDTKNGLNPIPVPGISSFTYRTTGVEHGEDSIPGETPQTRIIQMKKRFRKIENIEQENRSLLEWDLEEPDFYKADFSVIGWGITASVCRQAVQSMRLKDFRIAALYPRLLFPVCKEGIAKLLSYSEKLFIPESNFTGQYSGLIRMHTDAKPIPLTIFSGEPFTPEEIEKLITEKLRSTEGNNTNEHLSHFCCPNL